MSPRFQFPKRRRRWRDLSNLIPFGLLLAFDSGDVLPGYHVNADDAGVPRAGVATGTFDNPDSNDFAKGDPDWTPPPSAA